jgi:hypothetical protein
VLKRLSEERGDVLVVERVEHHAAIASSADEAAALQQPQLVRHRRLREPQDSGQVAHAQLAMRQRVEDADAGGVAERAESVGEAFDSAGVDQRRANLPDTREVDLHEVADVV